MNRIRFQAAPLALASRLALSAATLAMTAVPLVAQAQANAAARQAYDIPAGPLAAALNQFAQQSGVVLSYDATLAAGKSSPGARGSFTAQEGLAALLAGTGLELVGTGNAAYMLRRAAPASSTGATAPASTATLPVVTIRGQRENGYNPTRSSTATRTDTPLRDVPQAISVVTAEQIQDLSMQNIADVVRYMPGIGMAQGEGNRETPILRGNATTADFFIDGMRDDVQYFRDLYNIERVEALKGPNGMIFGRGGTGGIINRVSKEASWSPVRDVSLQLGSYGNKRVTADIGQGVTDTVAFRLNVMAEDSESYRDGYTLERFGINPTFTFRATPDTLVTVGAEYFQDDRVADRGISSYLGKPVKTDPGTFFGDPAQSPTGTEIKALNAMVEHDFGGGLKVKNRTRWAEQDKFYQNVFPGAVNTVAVGGAAPGTVVPISAYNNATQRTSLFNQTDFTYTAFTGEVKHQLMAGLELGRQTTDNFRATGYFTTIGANTTSVTVPVSDPRTTLPITFRQSATDADNHGVAKVVGVYLQDQIDFTPQFSAVLGLRHDQFKVDFHNNRTGADFKSDDGLTSPRVGLIFKATPALSLYASYSLAYQPRAGEQLSSLSLTNQALDPEKFTNIELGAKWDVSPQLSATAAVYQLDRTNVAITDPADPTKSILVDGQRSKGLELGLSGRITSAWSVLGAYAYQDAKILSTQSATVVKGASLAQVPRNTFSLWNRYDMNADLGFGLGVIHRSDMFAATDNTVSLPGYARVDAAVFYRINEQLRIQLNVENLFDREYYLSANSNTNITPGSPRAGRITLIGRF